MFSQFALRQGWNLEFRERLKMYTDTQSDAHLLSVVAFRHILTHCAHSQHFFYGSRSDRQNHIHQVILADLLFLRATETTSTTWTSYDQLADRILSALSGGMNVPNANTGYEHHNELDMAGRFVPIEDLTRDDEDGNSHVSDIPLRLPASANAASRNSALETFSHAEGDHMRNVPCLHPTPNQTGANPGQLVSRYISPKCTCSSRTSRSCSADYRTSTRSSVRSARNEQG